MAVPGLSAGRDEDRALGQEEIEAGMLAKSREFAESGSRVHLPMAD